jgi:hypothetical protein
MTETPAQPDDADESTGDELRQHTQEPAEGPDEETDEQPDVPRVHAEDPAEG